MTDLKQHTEGREVDVDWLRLIKTNHDVHVRVADKVDVGRLPPHNGLLSVANSCDLFAVGGSSNVLVHRLSSLHASLESAPKDAHPSLEPIATLALAAAPAWVRFAHGESVLIVLDTAGALAIYQVADLVAGRATPRRTEQGVPSGVVDVLPNPAPRGADGISRHVMIVGAQGSAMLDADSGEIHEWPGTYTCGAWSTKGKQIVLGTPSGTLETFTPDHAPKSLIPRPEQDFDGFVPRSVLWLENDVFLAQYGETDADSFASLEVLVISRSKSDVTFTRFFDPINTMGYAGEGPSSAHRHVSALRQWGATTRHLAFVLSGLASEVGVLHAGAAQDGWEVAMLDEAARAIMPTGTGGGDDTSCIGMDIDLTSSTSIRRGMEGGVEMPDIPPAPRLLVYSQEGFIISFDVRYPDAGSYPRMVVPGEVESAPSGQVASESPAPQDTKVAPQASEQNIVAPPPPPASTAFGGSAFGQTPAASAFGGFGQPAAAGTPSAFGSSSSTPSAETKPNAFAGFGQQASSTPVKPAFAGFGAQGSTTPTASPQTSTTTTGTAFGQSAFGSSATAFGQSGFGKSAFGQPSTPGASGSAFGQTAFGSSASGTTGSTTASGSAFGGFGKPAGSGSAFGQSGFGQSAFGQSSTPSSTPAKSPAPNAFGASAFGGSAFGGSAFGQSTTPSSTPAKAGGAFGASAFGASAFGQSTTPAVTPAKPAEGQTAPSAFGNSAFFQSAFGQGTAAPAAPSGAFAGFGRNTSTAPSTASASASNVAPARVATPDSSAGDVDSDRDDDDEDNFGVQGFSLALDSGSRSPAARIEHSPPTSPLFGKHATQPLSRDTRAQGGLDLASPPDSPPFAPAPDIKPKTDQSQSQSYAAFGTSSSGAFGPSSTGSGAFGAFGGGSSSKPGGGGAFGTFGSGSSAPAGGASSTTPAATPAKSPFGGGSGAPAFGQSSVPSAGAASGTGFGQKSTFGSSGFGSSAFGSSGFGASGSGTAFGSGSASGFGTAAKTSPAAGGGVGFGGFAKPASASSGGGFGGFAGAAKGAEAGKSTGGGGGFGGFASAAGGSGASVFGSQADKPAAGSGGFAGFGKKEQTTPPPEPKKTEISPAAAKSEPEPEPEPAPMPAGYDAPGPVVNKPVEEAKVEAAIPLPAVPAESESGARDVDEARGVGAEEEEEGEKEGIPSPDIQTVSSASSRGSGGHADEDEGELVQHEDAVETAEKPHILEYESTDGLKTYWGTGEGSRNGVPEVFEARVGAVFIEHEGEVEDVEEGDPAEAGGAGDEAEQAVHLDEEGVDEGEEQEVENEGEGHEDEDEEDDEDDEEEDEDDEDEDDEDDEDLSDSDDEYDRSISFPPEMPVIAEEEEDDGASSDGRSDPTVTLPAAAPSSTNESESDAAATKPVQTLKSPPTWFAKSTPSAFGSADMGGLGLGAPPSPSPKTGSGGDGSSLLSRIGAPGPEAAASGASSEDAKESGAGRLSPSSATTGAGSATAKPLFSSPHAVRASSPLELQPPASASDATSPVGGPSSAGDEDKKESKAAAPSAFGFGKPTAASGAGTGFGFGSSSFGQKSGSGPDAKSIFGQPGASLAPPSSTSASASAAEERKPSFGFGAAPPAFGQGTSAAAQIQSQDKPKDKPAFAGFGLGLGQPSTAVNKEGEATTAVPAQAAQTSVKPSFGFGAPPPAFGSTAAAPAPAPQTGAGAFAGFGGFGQKADTSKTASTPTPTASTATSSSEPSKPFGSSGFGGFGGFGAKAASPAPSTPTVSTSTPTSMQAPAGPAGGFFGFGKPAQDAQKPQAATEKPSFGSAGPPQGLGLGRPSGAPIATPTPPPVSKAPPAPAPQTLPPAPDFFTVPKREYVAAAPNASAKGGVKGMSETLKEKVDDLVADIDAIKAMLAAVKKHQKAFVIPNFAKITQENVEEHQTLPFSSIGDTMALARALVEELQELRKGEEGEEKVIGELQARMAKSDVKRRQLEQLAEAREKPELAQGLVTHELSPEQETSQITLRAAMAEVQARLGELEAGLAYLKDRSSGRGDASLSASVSEATRNMQSTLLDRQQTIEDLSRRLNTVRLDSPSARGRAGSLSQDSRSQQGRSGNGHAESPLRAFLSPLPAFLTFKSSSALRVPAAIEAEVREAIQRQEIRKGMLERLRQRPTREHGVGIVQVDGAVEVDDVPKPSRLDRDEAEDVKPDVEVETEDDTGAVSAGTATRAELATTASPVNLLSESQGQGPPPSFAGISINFSAAATSPLSASAGKGHGADRGGGSRRKVAPAAKYEPHAAAVAGGVGDGPQQPSVQSAPRFDFGFGAGGGGGGGQTESAIKPQGFFSFDGLGK